MTAIQTREPARTNPRNAQSAGSRQLLNTAISVLTTLTAVGIASFAAELAHKSYPACGLMALLLMPFINSLIPDRDARPSEPRRTAAPQQPTPEHYMPGGAA